MDRLARHIAVDQRLGQPLRQVGGAFQRAEPGGEGHRARPLGAERHPHVAAADLVAGALHQQPVRREPGPQPRPHLGDPLLVVLAQHVRRPDQGRPAAAREGHLEAAVREGEPLARVRPGGGDPGRVDLDADDLGVGARGAQPYQQLQGGPGCGAVAQVHGERVVAAAQGRPVLGGDPAVHAAQAVGVGRPPGHLSDRPCRTHASSLCEAAGAGSGACRRSRFGKAEMDLGLPPVVTVEGWRPLSRPPEKWRTRREPVRGEGPGRRCPPPVAPPSPAVAVRGAWPCSAFTPRRCTSPAPGTRAA